MSQLHTYSVMNLDTNYIEQICDDIKYQYDNKIANKPIFKMTLVPEGNPPVNKAQDLCQKYVVFKDKLDKMGIPSGVLVQASIGHGWVLGEESDFQKYVNFSDGHNQSTVCPYDEGFKKYIYDALKTIAQCNPDYIMIDDDLRLIFREGEGCACPLHLKRINDMAGTDFTREQMRKALVENPQGNQKLFDAFIESQKESVVEVAKVMRSAIDSVNPKIPGSFCCVGANAEFAVEIASVLAGKDNPIVIRINNGNYTAMGSKYLSDVFFRAATQIEKIKTHADVILDEPDTCPQNRYSTSASMVHSHFTGTILEGAAGAKHWITRLGAYEPQSGVAYRKMLSKYSGFYEKLAKTVKGLEWMGFKIPLLGEPKFVFGKRSSNCPAFGNWGAVLESPNAWGRCVLERLGLPMYFSSLDGGILCLEGSADACFDDEKMLSALSGYVFISSDSAKKLIQRGFGKYLGVDVKKWDGKQPTSEILYVNGRKSGVQVGFNQLVPLCDDVVCHSMVVHSLGTTNEELFPGVTEYKNELGGTVFVFCGTPDAPYDITTAFSFLNYSRKQQLIDIASKTGQMPVFYPGDEEVYFRCAKMEDESLFAAMINISMDKIENVELVSSKDITKIQMMDNLGQWVDVNFEKQNDKYITDIDCEILIPLILKLS